MLQCLPITTAHIVLWNQHCGGGGGGSSLRAALIECMGAGGFSFVRAHYIYSVHVYVISISQSAGPEVGGLHAGGSADCQSCTEGKGHSSVGQPYLPAACPL